MSSNIGRTTPPDSEAFADAAKAQVIVRHLHILNTLAIAAFAGYIAAEELSREMLGWETAGSDHGLPTKSHEWDQYMLVHHRELHTTYRSIGEYCAILQELAVHEKLLVLPAYKTLLSVSLNVPEPAIGRDSFLGSIKPTDQFSEINMPSLEAIGQIRETAEAIQLLAIKKNEEGVEIGWQAAFRDAERFLEPHWNPHYAKWSSVAEWIVGL
ncbi:uncharacterized protein LTR77_006064 [Saxophila tyrrhenica]|uniref:Uncharacterized protein n=1 Tax=Saxophila tyrrhenica TaxID=1690608 RepID=A0AAV9PB08_9PEZI|nr:hypothetical protein LTR77_006064 [Saxophila tyrrhenica]